RMLHQTRFAPHFQFIGDFDRHYGLFEGCGSAIPFDQGAAVSAAASCC
ncbi:MAG: methyltransferase type 11, partial [Cyanobacteria bacterium]|nr:methyltransferase type 11 [Cyanobacteriota bacterium]